MLASELDRQGLESCSKSSWPVGHTRISPEAVLSARHNHKERHATHTAGARTLHRGRSPKEVEEDSELTREQRPLSKGTKSEALSSILEDRVQWDQSTRCVAGTSRQQTKEKWLSDQVVPGRRRRECAEEGEPWPQERKSHLRYLTSPHSEASNSLATATKNGTSGPPKFRQKN